MVVAHLAVLAPVTGELHCRVAATAALPKVEEHSFAPAACLSAEGTHLRGIIRAHSQHEGDTGIKFFI